MSGDIAVLEAFECTLQTRERLDLHERVKIDTCEVLRRGPSQR